MPVPKFRTSKSKRNLRRAHHAISAPGLSRCNNCQNVKRPHAVCESCGHYRGKQVMEPRAAASGMDAAAFDVES